ncbi:hypothetical protein WT05_04375 [Burkholderia stagnalis]|nr:hypothetical protein WT05_04375 [Burkholderia stagnalis]
MLLQIRGYRTTVAATVAELRAFRQHRNHAAVVAYLDPAMRGEALFIDLLKRAACSLPIVVFNNPVVRAEQGEAAIDLPVATSIDALVAELDRAVGLIGGVKEMADGAETVQDVEPL